MIYTSPVTGDVRQEPVRWQPKTAFLMQQLGQPLPPPARSARASVRRELARIGFRAVDARDQTTGHDYLETIWSLLLGCPVGVALIHEGISPNTLANICFELGMMKAYGRETIIVRIGDAPIPSDLVRNEWIPAGRGFERRFRRFCRSLSDRERYYRTLAAEVEPNPLVAIDYCRRGYLLGEDAGMRELATRSMTESGVEGRARASVEALLISW